jgi:hypothetical protein
MKQPDWQTIFAGEKILDLDELGGGNIKGVPRLDFKEWPERLVQAMRKLADHRFPGNAAIAAALEYAVRAEDAPAQVEGYQRHLPAPKIGEVREIYRLLDYLLFTQVSRFEKWMAQPAVFE